MSLPSYPGSAAPAPSGTLDSAVELPPQRGGNGWRRAVAVVISIVLIGVLFYATALLAVSSLVGTPQRATSSLLAIADQPAVSSAMANDALNKVADKAGPVAKTVIDDHRAQLVAILQRTLAEPSTRAAIASTISQLYTNVKNGSGGTVSDYQVIDQFTSALHHAYPAIPASPYVYAKSYSVKVPRRRVGLGLGALGWTATVLGVLGAILVARFLVRRRVLRLVLVGLVVGVPGLIVFAIGTAVKRAPGVLRRVHDPTAQVLISHVLDRVGSALTTQGLAMIAAAVGIVVVWLAARAFNDRRRSGRAATTS